MQTMLNYLLILQVEWLLGQALMAWGQMDTRALLNSRGDGETGGRGRSGELFGNSHGRRGCGEYDGTRISTSPALTTESELVHTYFTYAR